MWPTEEGKDGERGDRIEENAAGGRVKMSQAREGGVTRVSGRKRKKGKGHALIQTLKPSCSACSSSSANHVKMPFGSHTGMSES
jgi:GMP synthase-like glutamine amidotransferase